MEEEAVSPFPISISRTGARINERGGGTYFEQNLRGEGGGKHFKERLFCSSTFYKVGRRLAVKLEKTFFTKAH